MIIGKDFTLTDKGTLIFNEAITYPEPDVRRLKDATHVLEQEVEPDDTPLYYMYRGVCFKEHRSLFADNNIRYDLTVLVPGKIGREYIKTVGHFHPLKANGTETFPEYYEVLSGEAIYLLQKNARSGDVEEVIVVEAKAGDKVFIPPGYGHVTINPGDSHLVMANLIESNFVSNYGPLAEKHGAAYYYIQDENGKNQWIKNQHYVNSVGLKICAAPSLSHPTEAVKNRTLYEAYIAEPKAFNFLK